LKFTAVQLLDSGVFTIPLLKAPPQFELFSCLVSNKFYVKTKLTWHLRLFMQLLHVVLSFGKQPNR